MRYFEIKAIFSDILDSIEDSIGDQALHALDKLKSTLKLDISHIHVDAHYKFLQPTIL